MSDAPEDIRERERLSVAPDALQGKLQGSPQWPHCVQATRETPIARLRQFLPQRFQQQHWRAAHIDRREHVSTMAPVITFTPSLSSFLAAFFDNDSA
jgi:hypothetical protein